MHSGVQKLNLSPKIIYEIGHMDRITCQYEIRDNESPHGV